MAVTGNGRVLSSTYEWEIQNYSSYNEMASGEPLYSSSFAIHNLSWHMNLYPNGDRKESQGFISLYLFLDEELPAGVEIHAQYTFYLINNRRTIIATFTPGIGTFNNDNRNWGKSKFVGKSLVNTENFSVNKISIVCEVILKNEISYEAVLAMNADRVQHFEGLKNLINNPKFSDVKFLVENKEIFAHKIMLVSTSTVFAAMFEHNMRENDENIVNIEDISYTVFNELLCFIYTGKCTLSKDIVSELFEAADKYQLLKLKDVCEDELCKNICVSNVIATLQLADMHSAERLKKEAIQFIVLHGKEFIDKPEFESITTINAKLLRDVFREIFTRFN